VERAGGGAEASPAVDSSSFGGAAAAGAAAAAPGAAAAAASRGIPVPIIASEPEARSAPVAIRPELIVGRSLCDVHSQEAISHAARDNSPIKMGQTPPLLSMIRQTVQGPGGVDQPR